MIRPFRSILAALALLAGLASCSTPTLPLPPPAALSVTPPDASGFVTVEGEVLPEAFVFCVNERTERGVIGRPDADGRFTLVLEAQPSDGLLVWQEIGTDSGERVSLGVPAP